MLADQGIQRTPAACLAWRVQREADRRDGASRTLRRAWLRSLRAAFRSHLRAASNASVTDSNVSEACPRCRAKMLELLASPHSDSFVQPLGFALQNCKRVFRLSRLVASLPGQRWRAAWWRDGSLPIPARPRSPGERRPAPADLRQLRLLAEGGSFRRGCFEEAALRFPLGGQPLQLLAWLVQVPRFRLQCALASSAMRSALEWRR